MKQFKNFPFISLIACLLALLCSCEQADDNYRYPSIVTDYACIITDATAHADQLLLDNGNSYPINITNELIEANNGKAPTFKPDTIYRIIGVYELISTRESQTAHLYSINSTISHVPTPLLEGEELCQSPVYLQSIWLSGGYLNMVLEIKALNGKHSIGYVDTTPNGMHGKEFTFYHKVINDVESYRQKLYGSIPLAPFSEQLQQGDTLRFVVNTYDEGITRYEYIQ